MQYAIYPHTNLNALKVKTEEVYLVRPIGLKKMKELSEQVPLKRINLSKSCLQRLPAKTKEWLKGKGIALNIEDKKGRALGIGLETIQKINEWRKDGQSYRKIQEKLGVPKSTVHYLVRYAERSKVKQGKLTLHLD
ncbi:MAG: hypothetical protein V1847_02830 [Candidatus Diapherotrites archaeon]